MDYLPEKYYIYVNGFWGGFVKKTNENHIDFFEKLFLKTKLRNFKFTSDINRANVLFESVFGNSLVNFKPWKYKIHYSGESYNHNISNYDLVLYCSNEEKNSKTVDLPLFAYYIHGNNLLDKLVNKRSIVRVPPKFCCFIVSNGASQIRNCMFEILNSYKKVDSYGLYKNNMGYRLPFGYWTEEYRNILGQYKFIICFENTKIGTYSTEKIVNPYLSGTIPIYWSSHQVHNVFNKGSMLFLENETNDGFQNLVNNIVELDNSDDKYLEFINRPVFKNMDYWNQNYSIESIANKIDKII
jgi:hypothetical protein